MFRAAHHRAVEFFAVWTACLLLATSAATQTQTPSSQSPPQDPQAQQPPSQPTPAQRPLPSSGPVISRPPIRFLLPRREYLCSDSLRLTVLVETKAVRLTLNNKIYGLPQVDSANGLRFTGSGITWLTDKSNDNGTLQDNADATKPQILAKDCRLQSTFPPVGAQPGTVTGTVSSRDHLAVPADAVLVVRLQDVTNPHGTRPTVAKSESKIGGRQLPIPFTLSFDPTKIDPTHTYAVEATIVLEGQLLFSNDRFYPVLTQGSPAKQDVILEPVADGPVP